MSVTALAFLADAPDGVRAVAAAGLFVAVSDDPQAPTIAGLRAHQAAVEALRGRTRSILPVRFGASFAGEQDLLERVIPAVPALRAALERVAGRVQMTVRILRPVAPAQSGTDYLRSRAVPEAALLRDHLGDRVVDMRVRPERGPFPATAYLLVDESAVGDLLTRIRGFEGARLLVSGPHAPWAFGAELGA